MFIQLELTKDLQSLRVNCVYDDGHREQNTIPIPSPAPFEDWIKRYRSSRLYHKPQGLLLELGQEIFNFLDGGTAWLSEIMSEGHEACRDTFQDRCRLC